MKKKFPLSLTTVSLLLISVFAQVVLTTGPTQPPVDTTTLYVGHVGWGPCCADSVRAYDTLSGELIFNVYDTLISMGKPVTNVWRTWAVHEQYWEFQPNLATNVPAREEVTKSVSSVGVPSDPTGFVFSDGSICVGWVDNHATGSLDGGDVVYTVETDSSYRTWFVQPLSIPETFVLWRGGYTFQICTEPIINFVNETGDIVDTFDVYDIEYSFERGLVQDQMDSPMWMFYKPFFDQMNSDFFDSNTTEPTAMSLAHLIDDAIEVSGNNITINVGIPFPDMAFKQILSQTWASIVSKEFSISIGCWNGDLYTDSNGDGYPDWFETIRRVTHTPYDMEPRYVGTGPYRVTTFDPSNNLVVLTRNELYWRGWPAPGRKAFLETIEICYMADWNETKTEFVSCALDVCTVPTANISELLDEYGDPANPNIKTIRSLSPMLNIDAIFFTFTINPESPYIGTGNFPNGIPPTFFNNTHTRKAFAYAFNHTKYIQEQYFGEAEWRSTPLVYGLYPDYHTYISGYDVDFDLAEAELKSAIFDEQSVWETGFTLAIPIPMGVSRKWAELICDFFGNLSTYDDRPPEWPDFLVSIVEYDPWWPVELTDMPIVRMGWLADFADADDFLRPYMHSYGDYAYVQNYTATNGWGSHKDELLDLAIKTEDGAERALLYAELEQIYIDDCPSFPIVQPLGRRWCKYWVKGWYHNALYPSDYYYHLYKYNECWCSVTGVEFGVPDGVCAMRDINFICSHFGASPPDPLLGYDPLWAPGTYGYAGCDVYGDRKVDMRDIGLACAHFGHTAEP